MQRDLRDVGDHFIVGLRPTVTLHERDRSLLTDLRPAGVIVYKSNFLQDRPYPEWLEALRKLIDDVRSTVGRDRVLIGIDHEGGRVCRTPAPITRFSYAAEWADRARAVGSAMGSELASLGVNLNFAPVLDIHSNPGNPVIGARAFGTNAAEVSEAALAFMSAMQQEGVMACGKHFPGHGDTDKDSHFDLPVLRQDLHELRSRELKPFVAAIEAGIPMIMTGHILLPAIDPVIPVTLSERLVRGVLRADLGFDGVIVSDDIGMHAVSGLFDNPSATVQLFNSGTDLMMVCAHWTDTDRCRAFAEALLVAQKEGAVRSDLAEQSRSRIRKLLAHAPQNCVQPLPEEILDSHRHAGPMFRSDTVEVI